MYEYIESNPDTWRFQKLPDVPEYFERELKEIAGVNCHNQPNLRVVRGNEVLSDKSADRRGLKYPAGYTPSEVSGYRYEEDGEQKFTTRLEEIDPRIMVVPAMEREQLGILRYVIEKWTSPEELERQGRFTQIYAPGDLAPTMRKFPREGIYEVYLIVENKDGLFRPLDRDVLNFIRMKWNYEQKPFAERERDLEAFEEKEKLKAEQKKAELWEAAFNFDLRLPKEELERREHYWATQHDYAAEAVRIAQTSAFYQR